MDTEGNPSSSAGKVLLALAIASFCVATAEGFVFFSSYESVFFRVLLILQNSILSFFFQSTISLDDALGTLQEHPGVFRTVVAYAYGVSTFTAPYCTAAAVYRVLERLLHFTARLRWRRAGRCVLVFGYNEDVKTLLANALDDPKALGGRGLRLICPSEPPAEERYRYYKAGWLIHTVDFGRQSLSALLRRSDMQRASAVLLMDASAIVNFSLLQTLGAGDVPLLRPDTKVFCRCEDDGMRFIIEDYFDGLSRGSGGEAPFDLEIVDVTELQVRRMYEVHPLHSHDWTERDGQDRPCPPAGSDPKNWAVHMLILGFGRMGQLALLQAMNLGPAHSENPILIDVVDRRVEEASGIFLSRFSPDFFQMSDGQCAVREGAADGSLTIRFHRMDVRCKDFGRLLEDMGGNAPFTYAVIAMEDSGAGIRCMSELQRYLLAHGTENVPVLLRMDADRVLSSYIEENEMTFRNVYRMLDRRSILSMETLFAAEFDRSAKEFNLCYSRVRLLQEAGGPEAKERGAEEAWRRLSLFQRGSSRALAWHGAVRSRLYGGTEGGAVLERLLEYSDGCWRYREGEDCRAFLSRLEREPFAREMARLEHRRWCYYMASIGWAAGPRNNALRRNPCMTDWETLQANEPETCVYDLMPLMADFDAKLQKEGFDAQWDERKERRERTV